MPCRVCAVCSAEFACPASFREKAPTCSGCRSDMQTERKKGHDDAGSATQKNGAAWSAPRHMTPCACHCAACREAGHGNTCVVLRMGFLRLFHGKADIVDLVLRHYHGASGWDTARFDAGICCVQYGPAGDVIAAGTQDGRIHLICAQMGEKILFTLKGHSDWVRACAFAPNGETLVSGSKDKTLKIWHVASGTCQATLEGHSGIVRSVAFSPNGEYIASASNDKTVRMWNANEGTCQKVFCGHSNAVSACAFAPNGATLVSASWDIIKIWDATSGACQATLEGHSRAVSACAFAPNGATIVSASWDTTLKIWDATSGVCQATLEGHRDAVNSVAFSPNGENVVSASDDRTVRMWSAKEGTCQKVFCGHSKDNKDCTCEFDVEYGDLETAKPACPVQGHRTVESNGFACALSPFSGEEAQSALEMA